jgi:hypothetical protein
MRLPYKATNGVDTVELDGFKPSSFEMPKQR